MISNFIQYIAAIAIWDMAQAVISVVITALIINYGIYLLKK